MIEKENERLKIDLNELREGILKGPESASGRLQQSLLRRVTDANHELEVIREEKLMMQAQLNNEQQSAKVRNAILRECKSFDVNFFLSTKPKLRWKYLFTPRGY